MSHQQRAKHASGLASAGSPAAAVVASPASMTAPSPAAGSVTAPSPAPTSLATPSSTQPPLPQTDSSTPSNAAAMLANAIRPPGQQQPQQAMSPSAPAGAPQRPIPGRQPTIQRQQLLNSVLAFYKSTNQNPPAEVFNNGAVPGTFKVGDSWIDFADLFFAVFRLGGMVKVSGVEWRDLS